MQQPRTLWSVTVDWSKKAKTKIKRRPDALWILAAGLIEALTKAQSFLDKKYGKGFAKAIAGEDEGTIDVF